MNKGDIVELNIERVVYRGSGLARLDGRVVFVPGVITGERVRAVVKKLKKRFAEAKLLEILDAAPARVAADAFSLAGGDCVPGVVYAHMRYPDEVETKQAQLVEQLSRFGGVEAPELKPAVASPKSMHYRNKITLHSVLNGSVVGYVGNDNVTVLDVSHCPLAVEPLNELLANLRAQSAFRERLATRQDIILRWTEAEGALFWVGKPDPKAPFLTQSTPLGNLVVPRRSFFQVNDGVSWPLLETVGAMLAESDAKYAVDLYCGVGSFALAAAAGGIEHVLGIESDYRAIKAAKQNATRLGLHAEFIAGKCGELVTDALDAVEGRETVLVVDPPRTGLESAVVRAIGNQALRTVIYVSCAPDTLGRDIKLLKDFGYRLTSAQLFDMFPRTAHFETVAVLSRD